MNENVTKNVRMVLDVLIFAVDEDIDEPYTKKSFGRKIKSIEDLSRNNDIDFNVAMNLLCDIKTSRDRHNFDIIDEKTYHFDLAAIFNRFENHLNSKSYGIESYRFKP